MLGYDNNCMIMSLKQCKIKFKARIKLNHNIHFLKYCNVAWSSTYCSNLNCIYLLQKRLVWLITKAHYLANTAPLFSLLKVLDIFSINSFSAATFLYSYHHNLLPSSFHDLFLSSNQVHQYEIRLASQYRPHFCRTNNL